MAILKGMAVAVVVDGKDLTEYDNNDDHDNEADSTQASNTVTKYIEVTSNTNFKVTCRCLDATPPGCDKVQFSLYLDGVYMDNVSLDNFGSTSLTGKRVCKNEKWTIENFRFAEIAFDGAQDGCNPQFQASRIHDLGTITVKAFRTVDYVAAKASDTLSRHATLGVATVVSEKILKGQSISHKASLDVPQDIASLKVWKCKYLDLADKPYAIFTLKYRSRRALQAELIIPRTPSPIPLELRPKESLSREELLELVDKLSVPIKPEIKADPELLPKLKRERDPEMEEIMASARSNKVARKANEIEVIDLLDD